jgi:hypothetical protein
MPAARGRVKNTASSGAIGKLKDLTNKPSALNLQIFRRRLAAIRDFLVINDLTLIQTGQTGLFDGRYVNKHVLSAPLRLNEPESLLRIEPLHRAARHRELSRAECGFHSLWLFGNPTSLTMPLGSVWLRTDRPLSLPWVDAVVDAYIWRFGPGATAARQRDLLIGLQIIVSRWPQPVHSKV